MLKICCLLEGKVCINDRHAEVCENEGKSAKLVVLTNLHIISLKFSNVPYGLFYYVDQLQF